MKMFQSVLVLALAGQMLVACGPKPAETPATTSPAPAAATPAPGETPATAAALPPDSLAEKADAAQEGQAPAGDQRLEGNLVKFPEAGVQFNVPAGWVTSNDGGNISVASPDGQLVLLFMFPPEEAAKATAEALGKMVDQVLDNVKPDEEVKVGDVEGMQWVTVGGTGDLKDAGPVRWGVDMIQARKPVVAFYLGTQAAWDANKAALEAFDESFLPIEGAAEPGADESPAEGDQAEPADDASPAEGGD